MCTDAYFVDESNDAGSVSGTVVTLGVRPSLGHRVCLLLVRYGCLLMRWYTLRCRRVRRGLNAGRVSRQRIS